MMMCGLAWPPPRMHGFPLSSVSPSPPPFFCVSSRFMLITRPPSPPPPPPTSLPFVDAVWSHSATAGPKDVVIVVDATRALGSSQWFRVREAFAAVLTTLSSRDYVNLVIAQVKILIVLEEFLGNKVEGRTLCCSNPIIFFFFCVALSTGQCVAADCVVQRDRRRRQRYLLHWLDFKLPRCAPV